MNGERLLPDDALVYYPMFGDGPQAGAVWENRHTHEQVVVIGHVRRKRTWIAYEYLGLRLCMPLLDFCQHWRSV